MATLTQTLKVTHASAAIVKKRDEVIEKILPRRCVLIPTLLLLVGMSVPLLMAAQILPASFLLGFVALILVAVDGVVLLANCGGI